MFKAFHIIFLISTNVNVCEAVSQIISDRLSLPVAHIYFINVGMYYTVNGDDELY